MNCTAARERLLEADAADLRGETDSELSRHLRDCGRCRTAAQAILEQERALARALAAVHPKSTADRAIEAARAGPDVIPLGPRWKHRWAALVPAAAAAALAGILLSGNGTPPVAPPPSAESAAVAAVPVVDAASSDRVVVFNTENPDIVVVWLY